tara:strand:- start:7851 stop:8306 length:456 start_codon:yes stop_codon:yes gene_type:complete
MKAKTTIGIDVGLKGGIVAIRNGKILYSAKTPLTIIDQDLALENLKIFKPTVYIEKVNSRPGQGVVSVFTFGKSYGVWLGLCSAHNMKVVEVTPQKWKKHFGLIGKDKQASIDKAKELFPNVDLKPGRLRVDSDGIAESILICKYGVDTDE